MKGISIAIETIVYLILAITVMTVALAFFLNQGGQAQTDFELEAARNSACAGYMYYDTTCTNAAKAPTNVAKDVGTACAKISQRRNLGLSCAVGQAAPIDCVQRCCIACPQPKTR